MLTQHQIDIIISTLRPYHPKRIGIFGSTARNEETNVSDLDILYQFYEPVSLFEKVRIISSLKESLQKEVDLISENSIHPYLKKYIYKDLKLIYEA